MLSDRLREILYPCLVVTIIGSLWAVGRAGEMEADVRVGLAPAPRWNAIRTQLSVEADREAHAAHHARPLTVSAAD